MTTEDSKERQQNRAPEEMIVEHIRTLQENLTARIEAHSAQMIELVLALPRPGPAPKGDQAARIEVLEAGLAQAEQRHLILISLLHTTYSVARNGPPHGVPPIDEQIAVLEQSERFDADWYFETHPDLAESELSPAEHYVRRGAYEGRNPGAGFDTMAYYMANPDIAQAGWPALVHYEMYGAAEGRGLLAS